MPNNAEIVRIVFQFVTITVVTILAERYISDAWALIILGLCLGVLASIHRRWLLQLVQTNRVLTVMVCMVVFALIGLGVGLWITRQLPKSGPLQASQQSPILSQQRPEHAEPKTAPANSGGAQIPSPHPVNVLKRRKKAVSEPLPVTPRQQDVMQTPTPASTDSADGDQSHDTTITNNIYLGQTPDVSHTKRAFVGNNLLIGPSNTLKISGEDTTLTHNTVKNMDVEVTKEARRTFLSDNLFESQTLVQRVRENETDPSAREALLHQIKILFEEHWKALPANAVKQNNELLEQFEDSVRKQPIDEEKSRALLDLVIKATPRGPGP